MPMLSADMLLKDRLPEMWEYPPISGKNWNKLYQSLGICEVNKCPWQFIHATLGRRCWRWSSWVFSLVTLITRNHILETCGGCPSNPTQPCSVLCATHIPAASNIISGHFTSLYVLLYHLIYTAFYSRCILRIFSMCQPFEWARHIWSSVRQLHFKKTVTLYWLTVSEVFFLTMTCLLTNGNLSLITFFNLLHL